MTAAKPYLSICPVGLVWFARHCGKMYSRHLFSYGGLRTGFHSKTVIRKFHLHSLAQSTEIDQLDSSFQDSLGSVQRTANFRNQCLDVITADYTIIMSRALKVTGNRVKFRALCVASRQ